MQKITLAKHHNRKNPYFCGMEITVSTENLYIHNSLKREKERFEPMSKGFVGLYVCGPTVYSDVHLGNCRTFVNFDLVYRYLRYLGFRVRYVRNITDVGHLEGDADINAEDKMAKAARVAQLEPMEVAQRYTVGFHAIMNIFNTLSPDIEPRATGHIPEQVELVEEIIKRGYAYEVNGSVYFDTLKFAQDSGEFGKLSGRVMEDLFAETRQNLKNQDEKRHPSDFAIWIKAAPEHLMRWRSPWSVGFPGWHLECSAMSTKYLGKTFDIHGGGFDLKFPHHENEIAQNYGACGCGGARVWMHANMLLLNGKKMSKSDGNNIMPPELFSGNSKHISKGYSPMVVRFFMLQSHYRSTLDLTDEALQAAEKGYKRLMEAYRILQKLEKPTPTEGGVLDAEIESLVQNAFDDLNDDFNAPKALSRMFELVGKINSLKGGQLALKDISTRTLEGLKKYFNDLIFNILGLKDEATEGGQQGETDALSGVMSLVLDMRATARTNKDWATSDKIRNALNAVGIKVKDSKEGSTWTKE